MQLMEPFTWLRNKRALTMDALVQHTKLLVLARRARRRRAGAAQDTVAQSNCPTMQRRCRHATAGRANGTDVAMSSVGRADNVALTCVDTHSCAMEFRSKIAEPTSLHTDLSLVPTPANLKDLTGGTAVPSRRINGEPTQPVRIPLRMQFKKEENLRIRFYCTHIGIQPRSQRRPATFARAANVLSHSAKSPDPLRVHLVTFTALRSVRSRYSRCRVNTLDFP